MKSEIEIYKEEYNSLNADLDLVNKVLDEMQKRDEDLYRVALYADKFPDELRIMGTGGSEKYNLFRRVHEFKIIKKYF